MVPPLPRYHCEKRSATPRYCGAQAVKISKKTAKTRITAATEEILASIAPDDD
jgi:hypothetical protein